jgi:hypothetical protein
MTIARLFRFVVLPLGLCIAAQQPAWADFEVRGPDGKRILLKDNGTWRHLDADDSAATATAAAGTSTVNAKDLAELHMLQRADSPGGCSYSLALRNKLPYEIRSLVFEFSALRANGIVYTSVGLGFGPVKPGNVHRRELRLTGIACQDIARLQVRGGDRCDMGDLNKFSEPNGQCLALVQVLPNEGLTFNK